MTHTISLMLVPIALGQQLGLRQVGTIINSSNTSRQYVEAHAVESQWIYNRVDFSTNLNCDESPVGL